MLKFLNLPYVTIDILWIKNIVFHIILSLYLSIRDNRYFFIFLAIK